VQPSNPAPTLVSADPERAWEEARHPLEPLVCAPGRSERARPHTALRLLLSGARFQLFGRGRVIGAATPSKRGRGTARFRPPRPVNRRGTRPLGAMEQRPRRLYRQLHAALAPLPAKQHRLYLVPPLERNAPEVVEEGESALARYDYAAAAEALKALPHGFWHVTIWPAAATSGGAPPLLPPPARLGKRQRRRRGRVRARGYARRRPAGRLRGPAGLDTCRAPWPRRSSLASLSRPASAYRRRRPRQPREGPEQPWRHRRAPRRYGRRALESIDAAIAVLTEAGQDGDAAQANSSRAQILLLCDDAEQAEPEARAAMAVLDGLPTHALESGTVRATPPAQSPPAPTSSRSAGTAGPRSACTARR
jgi:hypothetical protein